MLFVRLKQCEVALKAGRLDEAFALLGSPDLRSHCRGQGLVDRLGAAMLRRGRAHLAAGELESAAQDCERAARLAGGTPEVVGLRTAISEAMADRRRADRQRDQLASAVRRHIDQGQLTLGGQLLAAAPPDERVRAIGEELAARRAGVQAVAKSVEAALGAGDWEAAADHLSRADRAVARHPNVRELCGRVSAVIVAAATKAVEGGQLDRAAALLARHRELPARFIEADRLTDALRECREAAACVERADAAGAERLLRSLGARWPNASWIKDALEHVKTLRASGEALQSGPLGIRAAGSSAAGQPSRRCGEDARGAQGDEIDCVMHVDGAGSFQLVGGSSVVIGPGGATNRVDIALVGGASLSTVTIVRSDEDYFVQSREPIEVNDRPTTHTLLTNGDRIALGPRCRLRFRRPNPASTSAVLDVTSGRLARGDVRQILLIDRELILGPGPAAHVRIDALGGPALLQRTAAGIVCRAADPILIDGRRPAEAQPRIAPGVHVTIGPVGLVLVKEK